MQKPADIDRLVQQIERMHAPCVTGRHLRVATALSPDLDRERLLSAIRARHHYSTA